MIQGFARKTEVNNTGRACTSLEKMSTDQVYAFKKHRNVSKTGVLKL